MVQKYHQNLMIDLLLLLSISDNDGIRDEVLLKHTSTLTKRQARAVLKRVSTLKTKLKRNQMQQNELLSSNQEVCLLIFL